MDGSFTTEVKVVEDQEEGMPPPSLPPPSVAPAPSSLIFDIFRTVAAAANC